MPVGIFVGRKEDEMEQKQPLWGFAPEFIIHTRREGLKGMPVNMVFITFIWPEEEPERAEERKPFKLNVSCFWPKSETFTETPAWKQMIYVNDQAYIWEVQLTYQKVPAVWEIEMSRGAISRYRGVSEDLRFPWKMEAQGIVFPRMLPRLRL
jgi:hypothetical protein